MSTTAFAEAMSTQSASRTLFFFEKPSAMRQLQRFFKSPTTVCVSAEGHLLTTQEPGDIQGEWKPWRFEALPILLERIPVTYGTSRSGQSHKSKVDEIKKALQGVERVIVATDPGREGSMIAWEVLEHLRYTGRVDRLKLGALDDVSSREPLQSWPRSRTQASGTMLPISRPSAGSMRTTIWVSTAREPSRSV
jgi:DNA topoisomerase-3